MVSSSFVSMVDSTSILAHLTPISKGEETISSTWRIRLYSDANPLIAIEPTPKGLHYTGVVVSAWTAVIFGGG
jgi:hypothetical protein